VLGGWVVHILRKISFTLDALDKAIDDEKSMLLWSGRQFSLA
jgi:hypothetical protein